VAQLAADWDRERLQLETLTQAVAQVAANAGTQIENWGYAEKRTALIALKCDVTVYPPGHTPRADLTIRLPLRGALKLTPPLDDGSTYDMYFWNSFGSGLFIAFR